MKKNYCSPFSAQMLKLNEDEWMTHSIWLPPNLYDTFLWECCTSSNHTAYMEWLVEYIMFYIKTKTKKPLF